MGVLGRRTRKKVCVVLGGGGVRGLAHIGVLQVLEQHEIPVDCIVGTSVGAIVGASYALNPDALSERRRALAVLRSEAFAGNSFKKVLLRSEEADTNFIQNLLVSIRRSYVFSNLLRKGSIFPGDKLYEVVADLVPEGTFGDVKIPFAVPALDIRGGREVLLTEGSLRLAVFASCSLPGFFPPVEHDGLLLADAGVIGPVPISVARYFAPDVILAVDITSTLDVPESFDRGLDVILRVESIACSRLNDLELGQADVVIRPEVGQKHWSDFSGFDELVTEGVLAAEAKLEEIRLALGRRRRLWRGPPARVREIPPATG